MHFYNPDGNFYGGQGIVGAQVPVGTGLGFAMKYNRKGDDPMNVAITMYGDGAANQGQAWEAANMAKLWDLPVIYVIENNHYGMGTQVARSSANPDYYKQGGVVIPGVKADGMNVFASREAFRFCREWCSTGNGPIFLEMNTYRYHGHSMSDPGISYRERSEVQKMRKEQDPIKQVEKVILDNKLATKKELNAIVKKVQKEIDVAAAAALAEPQPDEHKLIEEIYSDGKRGESEIPDFIRMPDLHRSHGFEEMEQA